MRPRLFNLQAIAVAGLLFTPSGLWAETLPVTGDTSTNVTKTTTADGTNVSLFVGNSAGIRRTFVQFPNSSLPAGTAIANATLRFFVSAVPAVGSIEVHA